ncbi:MAG: hypothetical protein KC496_11260, partial [Anaerolineae bacterium]|nr:hypothetical protein [Anaerolineae bacterium]
MEKEKRDGAFHWQTILQFGLIAGIVLLYVGAIGMLQTFHEREIVDDFVTLGQILLYIPPLLGGFLVANRLHKAGASTANIVIGGIVVGALAAVPTIIMMFLAEPLDVRSILTNINRDWLELITFDNRNDLATGSVTLLGVMT